ncbi:MAG: epoxyqueuosine reductase QueH [Chloroflexota bacterium]
MRVLMHICCAHCALYPGMVMKDRGFSVRGLWFNPNIHPFTEYRSRLDAVRQLQQLQGLDVEYAGGYGLTEFLRNVVHAEERRCEYCYMVRLETTARRAREEGFDAFTTSLLVSPYQKFDMITEMGRMLGKRYSVEFYAEDFRDGFARGRQMGRDLGLYRQKYCGCIYSEMERYVRSRRASADPADRCAGNR